MDRGWRHHIEALFFVRTRGLPDAPALVWIHGLGESGLCFERVAARPTLHRWRQVVPDLPGYGRSAWPAEVTPLEGLADALAAWLEARGEAPAVIVGHSMGGVLGTLLAERHPARVRALLNVEGNLSLGDCAFSGPAARQDLEDFCAGGFDTLRERVGDAGAWDRAQRGYYASLRLADPRSFHAHSRALVAISRPEELAARFAALSLPRLYVLGYPYGVSARSRDLLAAARAPQARLSPAGHWPFLDHPGAFADLLTGFLAELPTE